MSFSYVISDKKRELNVEHCGELSSVLPQEALPSPFNGKVYAVGVNGYNPFMVKITTNTHSHYHNLLMTATREFVDVIEDKTDAEDFRDLIVLSSVALRHMTFPNSVENTEHGAKIKWAIVYNDETFLTVIVEKKETGNSVYWILQVIDKNGWPLLTEKTYGSGFTEVITPGYCGVMYYINASVNGLINDRELTGAIKVINKRHIKPEPDRSTAIKAIAEKAGLNKKSTNALLSGKTFTFVGNFGGDNKDKYRNMMTAFGFTELPSRQDTVVDVVLFSQTSRRTRPNVSSKGAIVRVDGINELDLNIVPLKSNADYGHFIRINNLDYQQQMV